MGDRSEHSKFPPSSAERRAHCPGSVAASETAPHLPSSKWSKEGTKAHKLLETSLTLQIEPGEAWSVLAKQGKIIIGGEAYEYNAASVDEDMVQGVQVAVDWVAENLPAGAYLDCEHRVTFPSAHTSEAWGTSDIIAYDHLRYILYVTDFKFGVDFVATENNRQLAQYGSSVFFSEFAKHLRIDKIVMVIVQPRNYEGPKVRSWEITPQEMLEWADQLDKEIKASLDPKAPRVAGPWCKYCPAEVDCPEKQKRVLDIAGFNDVKTLSVSQMPDVRKLDVVRLAFILNAKKEVLSWFETAEQHAHELARLGTRVPGFKVVASQTKRKWYGEPMLIADWLVQLTNCDLDEVFPRKLVGIVDAERIVKKAARAAKQKPEDFLSQLAFLMLKESSGNTSLVPESDGRPAIDIAATTFSDVKLIEVKE